jgi:hypothetical protein
MPTTTTHYGLLKPLVNSATDQDLWGGYLNTDMDTIDAQLWIAQNYITRAITSSDSVVVGDRHKMLLCNATSGAQTITLPAAATAGDGFTFAIKKTDATANAVTLDASGSETIDGSLTYALSTQNKGIILTTNGTAWYVQATTPDPVTPPAYASNSTSNTGTATAEALTPANFGTQQSKAAPGYQRLPGGIILQWGRATAGTGSVTFPVAFSSACYSVTYAIDTSTASNIGGVFNVTTTGFSLNTGAVGYYWIAVGS